MATDSEPISVSTVDGDGGPRFFLESGDHLSRAEFERRYHAMPHLKKAELVEGVAYVASPVRMIAHAQPHGVATTWLGTYAFATPHTRMGDNATVRLDMDNEFQPDVLLLIESRVGGRARWTTDDYLEGPPELVLEVAASSAAIDRHTKLDVYQRSQVQEYIVWQVLERQIEWFALREGLYQPLAPDSHGIVHSQVFPGLRLSVSALLREDFGAVLAEQQRGNASREHQAFVQHLAARQASSGSGSDSD